MRYAYSNNSFFYVVVVVVVVFVVFVVFVIVVRRLYSRMLSNVCFNQVP